MKRAPVALLPSVAACVALASGLVVIGAMASADTFSRADAGEQATDLVRAELSPEGLRRHRLDLELARDAFEELDEAMPVFAADLRLAPAELDRRIEADYPAVAPILDRQARRDAFDFANGIVTNLERHQEDFEKADGIPVTWLPMTAAPWVATAMAVALASTGLWALLRPGTVPLAAIAALGLVAVIAPLAVRFPEKAAAADSLLDTLNVTPAIAEHTRDLLESARAASDEMEDELFSDLAAALDMSSTEFDSHVAERFPAIARGRTELDAAFARYERRVSIREAGLTVVPEAKQFPLRAVTWWSVVPGAITAVVAGVAMAGIARRPEGRAV